MAWRYGILAGWGSLHESMVGLEGCDKFGGVEASKRPLSERIHIAQKSFRVVSSYSRLMDEGHRISGLGLGVDFQGREGLVYQFREVDNQKAEEEYNNEISYIMIPVLVLAIDEQRLTQPAETPSYNILEP